MISTIYQDIEQIFRTAFTDLGIPAHVPVVLQEASKPEFGDYQVNGAMAAAKTLKMNPRELAEKLIAQINQPEIISKMDIAGPGFINLSLNNDYLIKKLNQHPLKVESYHRNKVVIDLSAPNLAKEMHVGHLRSTIIGDALVRMYSYLGCEVLKRNHVGDWGTQFGMLTAYLDELLDVADVNSDILNLKDLEYFYRTAKIHFDENAKFANRAREYVVRLQSGDEQILTLWKQFVEVSLSHCQEIYTRLNTTLVPEDVYGESYYNDLLAPMVKLLVEKGIAVDSEGAKCVFLTPEELGSKEETPFIIQKKDGGYLYATTDIAAVYDRVQKLNSDRLVYVIDSRQALHMKQLFVVAKKAGIAHPETILEHAAFGTMMGEDGKPFKTRSGGTVKLIDLINESVERAEKMIAERNSDWSAAEVRTLAEKLGVGSIKYADLSKNRLSDYIFSFDKMLAFEGNTAPYLLYAYTRITSIFKKAAINLDECSMHDLQLNEPAEHKLALHVGKFADKLLDTVKDNYPHYMCGYLYELAGLFMKFYESCPILKDDVSPELKRSRLALAAITAKTLKTGLDLLGIETVDKM